MQAGDILLFKAEKNPISKIIAWGTNSPYSHVAVCVSPDLDLAIEAMAWKGIRARAISKIPPVYDVYRIKTGHDYSLSKTIAFLIKQLNSRYDYMGVFYLAILKLIAKLRKTVRTKANKWQKDRDYFCSELCYEAFNYGGLDIVPEVGSAEVTSPGDIAKSGILERI